jgi:hypothetical protein
MGLRGPIPLRDASRGNPGRRPAPPKIPPEIVEDAKVIYTRLKALGDYFGDVAEADLATKTTRKKRKRPTPALWAALRCWKEALGLAARILGSTEPTERDQLTLHLAKRPKAPHATA